MLRAQLQQGPLVAAAAPQPTVGSEVRWWRDAAAKHPLHLPPLCNPSPEFSIPGAAASHPAAASPALRCASSPACILPIAAGGCLPLVLSFLAVSFPASPCAAGWEWYGPPSSSRCSVDIARRLRHRRTLRRLQRLQPAPRHPGEEAAGALRGGSCSATAFSFCQPHAGAACNLSEAP